MQKRKQRKRTDTRVAELEREMRTMRQMLKNKQEGSNKALPKPPFQGPAPGLWYRDNRPEAPRMPGFAESPRPEGRDAATAIQVPSTERSAASSWTAKRPELASGRDSDVIDRGLLSLATARQLFETYRRDLFPHYPFIPIPDATTAEEMRATKPTLFLAIVAAAAAKEHFELSAALDKEVLQQYATRTVVQSEKSLELVQALHISAIWYHPPSKFGQLKYYEYIHMAATMAMDIGIGTRPVEHRNRFAYPGRTGAGVWRPSSVVHPIEDVGNPDLSMTPRSQSAAFDTGSTVSRRTFLACYAICAGVSLSLRRPNMLRANSYVRECADYLTQAPDALPTDRSLVAWARLIMIAEEISVSFSYDDPGGIASLTELRTQLMHRDFLKRLTSWYEGVSDPDMNGSLKIMYYTVRLYLHEIALHIDHSPDDFRAPYQMGTIHLSSPSDEEEGIPTQVLAEAIAHSIHCSHALLDTFLAMDADSCRALPVFSFVRVSFAAFILAKLCLSASHPSSRIGRVLDHRSLHAEIYLDKAVLHVREVVGGPLRCRVPAIFLALLFKLRQWCMHPQMIEGPLQAAARSPFLVRGQGDFIDSMLNHEQQQQQQQQQQQPPGRAGGTTTTAAATTMAIEEVPAVGSEQVSGGGGGGSSTESLPQTLAGDPQVAFESVTGAAAQGVGFPAASSGLTEAPFGMNYGDEDGTGAGASGKGMQAVNDFADYGEDAMQLDADFLASLGEMDAFPEGGLTGLDDWMPQQALMGIETVAGGDGFGWQADAGTGSENLSFG
ncbi:hypothetical protein B0A50_04234 [Salinomyces thailandicus]|uniref:Transcription factor domain-containing protein n=1 Tax=Salinomyces thailandicus TaxID=706561 RepID=A0A4U0TWP4_9PEZI|nr:hypothetical protein B0A50_04234 [Salinomyces thailandica]